MPHSLRCKIKHLCHNGTITESERDRILKALDQEPKIGHWRAIYQGDEVIDYRCSECEFGNTFGKSTWGMNYCPYCGAKMESEVKEND